jgi:hypothetical protein
MAPSLADPLKPLRRWDSCNFHFKILPFDKKIKRVTVSSS